MKTVSLSALAVLALAGTALAQSPYGNIQFRWREAGAGVTNSVNANSAAPALADINAAEDLSSPGYGANDRRFTVILEGRVTRTAGNTDLGGLFGMAFSLNSNQANGGRFASNNLVNNFDNTGGTFPDQRNSADTTSFTYDNVQAAFGYTARPAAATTLPASDDAGDRGVFGPFRRVADLGGKNQPAIGIRDAGATNINNVTIAASLDPLTAGTPQRPGAYRGRNDFYGLNTWVPIYVATYNLSDASTVRDIVISAAISGAGPTDSGLRGYRGVINPVGAVDSWAIDNAGLPTFTIRIIPAPGAAAVLGLGGLMVACRRRTA